MSDRQFITQLAHHFQSGLSTVTLFGESPGSRCEIVLEVMRSPSFCVLSAPQTRPKLGSEVHDGEKQNLAAFDGG